LVSASPLFDYPHTPSIYNAPYIAILSVYSNEHIGGLSVYVDSS
jgi:hypothetical protein